MAVQGPFLEVTVAAGEDLSTVGLYKAVGIDGVVAAGPIALGLLQSHGPSGSHIRVGYSGHMKALAGAVINSGSLLTVTTSGFMVSVGSASGTTVGKSITQAASGDLFDGIYDFARAGALA